MTSPAWQAWAWTDDLFSDVQLQLRTSVLTGPQPTPQPAAEGPDASSSRSKRQTSSPDEQPSSKAARCDDRPQQPQAGPIPTEPGVPGEAAAEAVAPASTSALARDSTRPVSPQHKTAQQPPRTSRAPQAASLDVSPAPATAASPPTSIGQALPSRSPPRSAAATPPATDLGPPSPGAPPVVPAAADVAPPSHPASLSAAQRLLTDSSRSYRLHAVLLASRSAYFKTRLAGFSGGNALNYAAPGAEAATTAAVNVAAGGGSEAAPRWLLVENVEEGELVAAHAVLRHIYTGQLGDVDAGGDGAAVPPPGVALLLRMMVVSDRWMMPECMAHSAEALAQCAPEGHDVATINAVLAAPRGWRDLPSYSAMAQVATERLLQLFGNAEDVCGAVYGDLADAQLFGQLLCLSLPSVLALLSSDRLAARSENSVLVMASHWLGGAAGAACNAAEVRQVAATLRLSQLSHAYLFEVLPQLGWLELSGAERASLAAFAAAGANPPRQPAAHTSLQEYWVLEGYALGPPAWYTAAPRAAWAGPPHLDIAWELPRKELLMALLPGACDVAGPMYHFSGFQVQLVLGQLLRGDGKPPVCFVGYSIETALWTPCAFKGATGVVWVAVLGSTAALAQGTQWEHHLSSDTYAVVRELGPLADLAACEALLSGGKLCLKGTVQSCG